MSPAETLLAAFANAQGLAGLRPDTDGMAGVTLQGMPAVDLRCDGDRLYVYGSLGAVPPARENLILTALLGLNRNGAVGEGPSFALDPTLGDIVLFREVDARVTDPAGLLATIGAVASDLGTWLRRLQEVGASGPGASDDSRPGGPPSHHMLRG